MFSRSADSIPWRRLFAFAGFQLLGALTPLMVLPILSRQIGQSGWVGLSIGFGVGAAAALLVNSGWQAVGPSRIMQVSADLRPQEYAESLLFRSLSFGLFGGAAAAIAAIASPDGWKALAALMAVAMASWGLSPSWFFVGIGKPSAVFALESLPRFVASALSVIFVSSLGAWVYPAFLLLSTVVGCLISLRVVGVDVATIMKPGPGWLRQGFSNMGVSFATLFCNGYTNLAVPIASVAGASVAGVGQLAAAVRVRGLAQAGTLSVSSAFQGWVSATERSHSVRRATLASCFTVFTGMLTSLSIWLLFPAASSFLAGELNRVQGSLALASALACVAHSISATATFHWLVPLRRIRVVSASYIFSGLLGAGSIAVLSATHGALGAALGVLLGEACVALIQLSYLSVILLKHRFSGSALSANR